jgi:hypothetical protein
MRRAWCHPKKNGHPMFHPGGAETGERARFVVAYVLSVEELPVKSVLKDCTWERQKGQLFLLCVACEALREHATEFDN